MDLDCACHAMQYLKKEKKWASNYSGSPNTLLTWVSRAIYLSTQVPFVSEPLPLHDPWSKVTNHSRAQSHTSSSTLCQLYPRSDQSTRLPSWLNSILVQGSLMRDLCLFTRQCLVLQGHIHFPSVCLTITIFATVYVWITCIIMFHW